MNNRNFVSGQARYDGHSRHALGSGYPYQTGQNGSGQSQMNIPMPGGAIPYYLQPYIPNKEIHPMQQGGYGYFQPEQYLHPYNQDYSPEGYQYIHNSNGPYSGQGMPFQGLPPGAQTNQPPHHSHFGGFLPEYMPQHFQQYQMPLHPMEHPAQNQQQYKKANSPSPFENPLQPVQKRPPSPLAFANPYPNQQFIQKQPSGIQSVLNQFKTQDGSIDINKMMNTAGQVMNTFSQVSSIVKGFGGMIKV